MLTLTACCRPPPRPRSGRPDMMGDKGLFLLPWRACPDDPCRRSHAFDRCCCTAPVRGCLLLFLPLAAATRASPVSVARPPNSRSIYLLLLLPTANVAVPGARCHAAATHWQLTNSSEAAGSGADGRGRGWRSSDGPSSPAGCTAVKGLRRLPNHGKGLNHAHAAGPELRRGAPASPG